MANVNGNYKNKSTQLVVYSKGEALKSKIRVGVGTGKKFINKKVIPSATKTYKSYVAPTVGLFKGAANIATGVGKLALRNPLLAAGTYVASKGFNPKGKFSKGRKFNEFGDAGKVLSKGGRKFYG